MPTTIPQAGGHQDQVSINSTQPDKIIKKTNHNELEFYQNLVNQLEHHHHLKPDWRPQFFGTTNHHHHHHQTQTTAKQQQQDEHVFIILENLTYKRSKPAQLFIHPNVIDIKLGQRLYDDRATPEKQERMNRAALETTSAKFGIRLTGAQLWKNLNGEYSSVPKSFGKSIKPDGSDLQTNFNSLFPISNHKKQDDDHHHLTHSTQGLPSNLLKIIIDRSIIPKIQTIQAYLSSFNWRIYGASLLIVFEADLTTLQAILASSTTTTTTTAQPDHYHLASVKVIDFAHVELADSPDQGLLKGIQSTLDLFHQLSQQLPSDLT
ncbi:hypothetical protein PGT21_035654 [Puccinia graminis f. sp. tritici]|uniref:Kinase n=1 Tax=Puccinia graminis f. sp. tritici TaxID=56615 RepID=A0A5B0MQ12_PUCGR|nr:hypothetical protein PGT21_035654 [Puccinia graminis f. sp. tritici]